MTRVKICGINDAASFDTVVAEAADYVGFVFFPPSPRYVTPEQAAELSARHKGGPQRVALFVDPTDTAVDAVIAALHPDILQIYTNPDRATEIRTRTGLPVWRAMGVAAQADLPREATGIDALLIEAKPPKDATRPGGNALSFDWSILRNWQPGFDWVLAGGLNPSNVGAAVRISRAPVVDVSSGVESAPGVKSPDLIRAFIEAARE
jgi:phosphoribosylanthranilate isomerase